MKSSISKAFAVAGLAAASCTASASIVSISTSNTAVASHSGNLISNGSFETRNVGDPAITNNVNWSGVQGQHLAFSQGSGAVYAIPAWAQSSGAGAYGVWGSAAAQGGAACTDGVACLYFGNHHTYAGAGVTPTFNANGTVTFSSTPTFTNFSPINQTPTTLSQVLTGLVIGDTYLLDFWTSGEDNTTSLPNPGVFGLNIGNDSLFLTAPSINSVFSAASKRYQVTFTATSTSEAVSFVNWGHIAPSPTQFSNRTELILDDVIVNHVPEPGTLALALGGVLLSCSVRQKKRS